MLNRLFIFILICLGLQAKSQSLANYTTLRTTAITYNSISSSGTPVSYWRNTTINQNDDNRSISVPIGFEFWYLGKRYTTVSICSNGYIDFSSTVYDGNDSPTYPSGSGFVTCGGTTYRESPKNFYSFGCAAVAPNYYSGTYLALAPFYTDLWVGNAGVNAIANSIKYQVSGTAPNRIFTAEYISMDDWASAAVSNYNFQVKLYESSGVIEFVYGTMAPSSGGTPAYGCGLNTILTSAAPSAAELKMQQTANTSNFNNTPQAGLTIAPASNSKLTFSPPCPVAPTGALSFSGITTNSMVLNWTNWASNEVAYAVYYSLDNITYTYFSQTNANVVSYSATNLLPNTTYYWKIYAVTEGCLSAALSGNATTLNGSAKISNQTGNWSNPLIWTPNGVPTSADNVTIANGHTVSIDVNAICSGLFVGQGAATTLQFIGATARTLSLGNQLLVNSNASFIVNPTSASTHSLFLNSNVVSNGTFNLHNSATSRCKTYFSNNIGDINISGSGSVINFSDLILNLNSPTNTLTISSSNFSASTNFLTLTQGILNFATINAVTITPYTTATLIPYYAGLILNSPNLTINTSDNINLLGKLTVNSGTINIGSAANKDLQVSGGNIILNSGSINVAGKLYSTGINDIFNLTMSGGVITVPTIGSTNTTISPFDIRGTGSNYRMTGGLIVIPLSGGTGAQKLGYQVSGSITGGVSGGTLQIGNTLTTVNHTIQISSTFPVNNLVINSARAMASIATNSLVVLKDVAINSGTLNANALSIQVGNNWTNTSLFMPGTGSVIFNSNSSQTITRLIAGGETFNDLLFTGSGVKTFSSVITTSGNFSISTGANVDVSTSNYQLTVKRNFLNNGSFNARNGLVFLNGTVAQTIGGTSVTDFYDLSLTNSTGASLTSPQNLNGSLFLNGGTFASAGFLTLVSTASASARIAQITGSGDITGNVIVQRFAPGGTTGWTLIGGPISSALTFADWNDDIPISCPTCPNGFPNNFYSIYSYDETKPGTYSATASYIPVNNITDPIVSGKGYWVYFGNGQFTTTDIVIDVTGTVRKFNYTIPLTYSNYGSVSDDGWNLIHNPYPSPISWSALKGATANLDNAIYAYNPDLNGGTGLHATYINGISSPAIGSGGIGDVIPMSQGFYVHSTGATTLNATEAIKVSGNPTFLKTNTLQSQPPLIRLLLDGPYTFHDETVLYLQSGATNGFDANYDAFKMAGQDPYAPFINLENNTHDFQVNGVSPIAGTFSMNLKTLTGYTDSYTISASNYSSFPTGACIMLYDKFTLTTTNLKTSDYVFTLMDTTTVARFVLNITINPLVINSLVTQPSCQFPTNNKITVSGTNSGPWNYYWKDINGNILKTSLNKTTSDTLSNLTAGTYDLEINTVGQCDNNSSSFFINSIILPTAVFASPDSVNIANSSNISFTNTSVNATSYLWDFGDNAGTSLLYSPVYGYYTPGVYTISLISTSIDGCSDTIYKPLVITANSVGFNQKNNNLSGILIKTLDNNLFLIEGNFVNAKTIDCTLQDVNGKLLLNYETIYNNYFTLPVNLQNYSSGTYFITIIAENEKKVIKLPVR